MDLRMKNIRMINTIKSKRIPYYQICKATHIPMTRLQLVTRILTREYALNTVDLTNDELTRIELFIHKRQRRRNPLNIVKNKDNNEDIGENINEHQLSNDYDIESTDDMSKYNTNIIRQFPDDVNYPIKNKYDEITFSPFNPHYKQIDINESEQIDINESDGSNVYMNIIAPKSLDWNPFTNPLNDLHDVSILNSYFVFDE
jgi:hypothetical protein